MQVICLLAQRPTVGATCKVTASGERRIAQLVERYDASGPEALADGLRRDGPKPRLVTPEVRDMLRVRLAEPRPDGGCGRAAR